VSHTGGPDGYPPGTPPGTPSYGGGYAPATQGHAAPPAAKPPFYYTTPFLIGSFFCCWPVGVVLVLLSPSASKTGKIAAAGFGGLCLIGSIVAATASKQAPPPASTATVPVTAAPAPTPEPVVAARPAPPAKKQPQLGEAFSLGEFQYVVKKVEITDTVGKSFSRKKAGPGATYVIVRYTIRNDGKETATVLADDFKIVDSQSRQFRPSSEANTALTFSEAGKDFILSEVQPGLTREMATAFEVPSDVASGVFDLVIPEKGLLGTDEVRITLK
jgi:hypothetical protein